MKLNRIAVGGVAGIMGLGLIGVGAHAAFTTTTQSHQQVSTGTVDVVLTSAGASTNTTHTIRLTASATHGSSFTTGTTTITIKNIGSLKAFFTHGNTSVSPANSGLATHAYICVVGTSTPSHEVLYNGPLVPGMNEALAGTVAPGGARHDIVNVYAGTEHTACGTAGVGSPEAPGTSVSPPLNNTAEGQTITVTYKLTYLTS